MTQINPIYHRQPSLGQMPVAIERRIVQYLGGKDRENIARVSKRFGILIFRDPSFALENMERRKIDVVTIDRSPSEHSAGPTQRFLFSNSPIAEKDISLIFDQMITDRNVGQTVLEVCQNELIHPRHVPLYHALGDKTFALWSLTEALVTAAYLPNEPFPTSVPLLRFPSFIGPKTIDFSITNPNYLIDYDNDPSIQKELLACNPHLFANLHEQDESTWQLYLENSSCHPPSPTVFFGMLFDNYHLSWTIDDYYELDAIYQQLIICSREFAHLNLNEKTRSDTSSPRGILLQILVPTILLDQIAYVSQPFGRRGISSRLSLSQKKEFAPLSLSQICSKIREEADVSPRQIQVRLLAQSIFIKDYGIKVFVHGHDGFFSQGTRTKKLEMSEEDWAKQKSLLDHKEKLFHKAKNKFIKMILAQKR